jgi:hypothetical protein
MGWAIQSSISGTGKRRAFSLFQNVQIGSGAHPSSYSVGTRGFFHRGEVAGM